MFYSSTLKQDLCIISINNLRIWVASFIPSYSLKRLKQIHHDLYLSRLKHPVSVPQWGSLHSPWKKLNFQKLSGVRPRSKLYTRETTKPTGDKVKIQLGEFANILCWLKNIYTWLTPKKFRILIFISCKRTTTAKRITANY